MFEAAFAQFLGIERTIWLEHGLIEDRTGGHVDNVAAFIGPNRVACQAAEHPDPNHAPLERNRETARTQPASRPSRSRPRTASGPAAGSRCPT